MRIMHAPWRTVVLISIALHSLPIFLRAADEWPSGYVVNEESISPDKHYGIVLPSKETGVDLDEKAVNYVADLTTHRLLGKIKDADYFEGQNHAGLSVTWADDSKLAIVDYEGRFGFGAIIVIEPNASSFAQTEIGAHIQKAIDAVIAKQAREREASGYVNPLFRIEPGRKIRVYAPAETNPKQLEEAKSYFALFQGLFDLPEKKWTKSTARPMSEAENDLLDRASENYDDKKFKVSPEAFKDLNPDAIEPQLSGDDICFRSEESEFKYLDDRMNDVYKAARFILPPADFAKVQADQREWLKKRDAAGSLAEKSKLTIERTSALQDASW
jgi:hypothetical protein